MEKCTSCTCKYSPEAFVLNGKVNKTCATCLTNKAKTRADKKTIPDHNQIIETILLNNLNEYVIELMDSLENNMGLSFTIHVDVNMFDQNCSIKSIANMIINNIEEGDSYSWVVKTAPRMSACHENVSTFYFSCSQSNKLACDYKESNRPRMEHFNCNGALIIHVDMPAAKVTVKLKHEILYERSIDVATPEEIKQAIQENIHMDPSFFTQNFYKSDDDHVNSAYSFLKSNQAAGCELCYELMTSQTIAIGFITPLYGKIKQMSEIHCDATYKTAKGRFELYGLICNVKGAGYPLAYLILDTTKISDEEPQNERRTHALSGFFESIRNRGLYPDYFYTDKDFSEINAQSKFGLMLIYSFASGMWREQLVKSSSVAKRFNIFRVLDFIKMHFNQHSKVPVNANGQFLTPIEIRKNAVREMYEFCFTNEKLYNPEGIQLVYSNFERNTDYPFLTLKSSSNNPQNQHFNKQPLNERSLNVQHFNEQSLYTQPLNVDNKLSIQANIKNYLIATNENNENFNPELYQQCKSKIVALERLVKHLNDELSENNLQHIENVVNNMKHTFTIIDDIESSQHKRRCSNTWSKSKPWALFLQ
ncbi:20920_t:CDS:2 [Cetraspora pellucida]|uniref:20920_t:CDS:1 n=1 Tax=Cetraspora pellucida TaxID=1433469 RepID=A0A9N9JW93_9GLOM|nr:20920_t:CDS:2 [Cetraspora pellucida]